MEITFDQAKLCFLADLSKDRLVQELDSETVIKDLIRKMTTYMHQANQANLLLQHKERVSSSESLENINSILEKNKCDGKIMPLMNRLAEALEKGYTTRARAMILDFEDVKHIAYTVGTYQDNRNILQRLWGKENPLDKRVEDYFQHYERFTETGDLYREYFEEDTWNNIRIIADQIKDGVEISEGIIKLYRQGANYADREETLLRLADSGDRLKNSYGKELTRKDTLEIEGHFRSQAIINEILFKTLDILGSMIRGLPNPVQNTEKLHAKMIKAYQEQGYIGYSCAINE